MKSKEPKSKKERKAKDQTKQTTTKAKAIKRPRRVIKPPKPEKISLVKKYAKKKAVPLSVKIEKKPDKIQEPPVEYPLKQELMEQVQTVTEQVEPEITPPQITPPKVEKVEQTKKVEIVEKELPQLRELELEFPISVKDLSVKLQVKTSQLIQELMRMNIFATINQLLSHEDATRVCEKFGFKAKSALDREEQLLWVHHQKDDPQLLKSRQPVVTLMGHVDHGKTSLLDIIRKTNIVNTEHGGITQHIGAYEVSLPKGKITFLDTPGHEAFTAMRSRGAHITDIVVLVVAADDGVMPQTIEAIDHARAAEVPIVVAINKIDRPQADIDRVKKQLQRLGIVPEDWQGKTITVAVSAKTGEGVDELLEMILLEAEMLDLKANYQRQASGVVIESRHDKNRGPLATLLVENGTLHLNDNLISGLVYGKVKAIFNDSGQRTKEAAAGTPVEVLGLTVVPEVGDKFFVLTDEKQVRELVALRQVKERQRRLQPVKRLSLEDLHSEIQQGKIKELKIIIKADVSGSLEVVCDSLEKLQIPEVKFHIMHAGIGSINTSDVMLAKVTNAFILGFNVQPDGRTKELIEKEGIEVRTYNIIYELIQELKAALEGLLEPEIKKVFLGRAQVRKVFKLSKAGTVAGCYVNKGKILRSATVNLIRDNKTIFEGKISNLKRYKDDAREISEGFECGISLTGFQDYHEGDVIEAYEIQKISRRL